jgi:signal transduction histidine kinase
MTRAGSAGRKRLPQLHAVRVAIVATAVVMTLYVLGVLSLNILVNHRLTATADTRLNQRLAEPIKTPAHIAVGKSSTGDADHDIDDAPRFVWAVSHSGSSLALTPGSPSLPRQAWSERQTTVMIAGTPFRFAAKKTVGGAFLVAGESIAQIVRVQSALATPEIVLGIVLLVLTFVGSLVIGARVSAPLELIHRRQVEFTADASHELRTPLSVIDAEVGLALSRPREPEEYQAVLRRITGEGHRLRQIVEDLLWLARMDEQTAVEHDALTDVASVAMSSVERFQSVATARHVELTLEATPVEPAVIWADPKWIDRLVGVLVDNACRFAGEGGHVDVGVRSTANRVVLRIDDTGPGIAVEDRPLVFDRFHRGSDQPGGAGLGLAIADSVVSATSGTWHIGDAPMGGARMQVSWKRSSSASRADLLQSLANIDRHEESSSRPLGAIPFDVRPTATSDG